MAKRGRTVGKSSSRAMASGAAVPPVLQPLTPPTNDPAWQPPRDRSIDPKSTRIAAEIINREIPNSLIQTQWSWPDIDSALQDLSLGIFDRPAQLVESILGDDRVQATNGSRTGGLLGRPIRHASSTVRRVKGSDAARECLDAWREAWPTIANEASLSQIHQWGIQLAMSPAQILWDASAKVAVPHLRPWHPRYTYYQVNWRTLIAITLDGLVAITPGDGHWLCHAPHGMHRGWMRGTVRAIAKPWIQRAQTYRDLARFCERHGFPILKFMPPASADPAQVRSITGSLESIGQESLMVLPQGVDKELGYGLDYLETKDSTWEVFIEGIRLCDAAITLAMLGQNLTTEVKEGSFAAARVHGDVRQSFIEFDARALATTIYQQVARPFAAINFGDADLAPSSAWEITPYEDNAVAAKTLLDIATAVKTFREAGYEIADIESLARSFDLSIAGGKIEKTDPILPGMTPSGGDSKALTRIRVAEVFDATRTHLRARFGTSNDVEALFEAAAAEMDDESREVARRRIFR